eukprot:CAMPEP_0206137696 /NCGR_PEP_ID=MMETSP1473-20131121/2768_1 /ASSEMBLY_ACC=CAM_ASM_001109 /TAXON_ID=1461547 /ORGANISM="Stichococcus sp, Strain RCC1054" /LENGTH=163 /DNA_ID=CAMNT_0053530897 /DNA_START=31 /DNA_END=522 /DNA_ORIENTATION=-
MTTEAKAGDKLPAVTLYEGDFDTKILLTDLFKGKKGALFGVPGAFTPICTKTHLPSFVDDYEKLKEAGAEVIACITVNDPWVTAAWAESAHAEGKVKVLADPKNEVATAMGVVWDISNLFGHDRSKRFSAVIADNEIKTINVEPSNNGLACSISSTIIDQLRQ